jgi:uncharacterized membrane protein
MSWLTITCIGYILLGCTFILDKYILSQTSLQRPSVYAFYSTIIMWGALVLLPFNFGSLSFFDIGIGLFSGIMFGVGLLTLYIAVKGGEASHINPFSGAIVAIATYGFSSVFLEESLSRAQLFGIVFLALASILLSYQETLRTKGYSLNYLWGVVSGVAFALSHVSAKYLYLMYDFLPAFAWSRAGAGIVGLLLIFYPPVFRDIRTRFFYRTRVRKKVATKPQSLALVWFTKIIGIGAVVLIQYAGSIGSVSIVQAFSGLQYAFMFVIILISSRWFPKIFKEYFSRRELQIQTVGILLVVVGSLFFI